MTQTTLTSFDVLGKLQVDVEVANNPFGLPLDKLFLMGARVNPKRSFLFVNTLLGKHLDVHPQIPKIAGHILANLWVKSKSGVYFSDMEKLIGAIQNPSGIKSASKELSRRYPLSERVLFIGFAETATGLGHAVFSAFENAEFVHTTRESYLNEVSVFDFEEEHSHATNHACYLKHPSLLEQVSEIVVIDDEITTGNTALNLIRSLNKRYPGKRYTVLSLLDWRTEEHRHAYASFMRRYGIRIETVSLIQGEVFVPKTHVFTDDNEKESFQDTGSSSFSVLNRALSERIFLRNERGERILLPRHTGRFGLSSRSNIELEAECEQIGSRLRAYRQGKRTLCLGTGELMYIPARIAAYMGKGVTVKSTTRSPIVVSDDNDYPIHNRLRYQMDADITYYLYNITSARYDEVFVFLEGDDQESLSQQLARQFAQQGIEHVTFVNI